MLIVATTITVNYKNTYELIQITEFVEEMQLIQKKIDEIAQRGYDADNPLGQELTHIMRATIDNAITSQEISAVDGDYSNFRYFSKQDILDELNFEGASNDIIVNFVTREIISMSGIEYEGKIYYTQYKLPNGQTLAENYQENEVTSLIFTTETKIKGLHAKILVSDIKRVEGETYTTITNYILKYKLLKDGIEYSNYNEYDQDTGYWEYVTEGFTIEIAKSGTYVIALLDKNNTEPYTQKIYIELVNEPELDGILEKVKYDSQEDTFELWENEESWYDYSTTPENWAYAKNDSDSKYYVWIPRLASDPEGNIRFLKSDTNIVTDDTVLSIRYIVPTQFTNGSSNGCWREVQGVITSKEEVINILEST